MTRKRKDKRQSSNSSDQKTKRREVPAKEFPAALSSFIGMIGWNSPKFLNSHGAFIELLKKNIEAQGAAPLFFGISGGSDPMPLTVQNDAPKSSRPALHALSTDSESLLNGHRASPSSIYGLPSRDMIADQIEIVVQEENLKGLALIPWSINSLVGMLMATVRCGIPVLFMPHYRSWEIFSRTGWAADPKKIDLDSIFYSRCSLLILLEVLGLSRIGTLDEMLSNASVASQRASKKNKEEKRAFAKPENASMTPFPLGENFVEIVEWAAKRIVEISKQKISPRRFFSQSSFQNAICVDRSLGGSTETILHLSALAHEAGVPLPLSFFNESSQKTPQLIETNRSGEFSLGEFRKRGGLNPLLGALHGSLQPSPTVIGKNIIEVARENSSRREAFKAVPPSKKQGGVAVLFGNLAREGALFRVTGLKEHWLSGSGTAKVFDMEAECIQALRSKKIKKGELLVLRYCGPKGSPGMPYLSALKDAMAEAGLEESVAVLTDGRVILSGKTPAFVHVSPEAAVGSALSVMEDGDVVTWNFFSRTLSLRLTDTEIKVRLSRWKEQGKNMKNSFLYRYCKYASPSSLGATLV